MPYVDLGRHAQHRGVDWPLVRHHLVVVAEDLWRHLFGIVVVLVALTFTGGVVVGFLLDGDQFAALLSGLIGLTSIAIGITYHSIGDDPAAVLSEEERQEIAREIRDDRTRDAAGAE